MPMYTYRCPQCYTSRVEMRPIAERDNKAFCGAGHEMTRAVDKPGLVWAPTAGGMRT